MLYASIKGNPFETWDSISGYRIKPNGRLQPLPGSPFKVAGGSLAVDPFNRFLYAATDAQNGSVSVYRIHANGALEPVPGSPFPSGSFPASVTTDPFGRFVYVANFGSKDISAYRVLENGTLIPVLGSPFPILGPGEPITVLADPLGRFLYAANFGAGDVSSYRIGLDGSLTPLAGSPSPFSPAWYENMAIDRSGRFLFALEGVASLVTFRINNTTGLPEIIDLNSLGDINDNNPVGVAVDPAGKFVYEGNANGIVEPGPMTLRGFQISPTGTLKPLPGSPFFPLGAGEGFPYWMVVAPDK